MFDRDFAAGNGDKTPQPGFARQKIVVRGVEPPFGYVVPDGKQPSIAVIQEAHVDRFIDAAYVPGKLALQAQHLAGEPFRNGKGLHHPIDPFPQGRFRFGSAIAHGGEREHSGNIPGGQIGKAGRLA